MVQKKKKKKKEIWDVNVCNGCNDLTMLCLSCSDIAIITVKGVDYCCIIHDISKSEAIHLLQNSVLDDCGYKYKIHVKEINIENSLQLFMSDL